MTRKEFISNLVLLKFTKALSHYKNGQRYIRNELHESIIITIDIYRNGTADVTVQPISVKNTPTSRCMIFHEDALEWIDELIKHEQKTI